MCVLKDETAHENTCTCNFTGTILKYGFCGYVFLKNGTSTLSDFLMTNKTNVKHKAETTEYNHQSGGEKYLQEPLIRAARIFEEFHSHRGMLPYFLVEVFHVHRV